ncbi:MAG: DMT family transporter [Chloroflexota bacterium]
MNWGALVAVLLWGASFVAVKVALIELAPVHLVLLRVGLAALALDVLLLRRDRRAEISDLTGRDWTWIGLLVLISVFPHQLAQVAGLQRTTAINGALLITLAPLFMFGLSAVLFGEAVTHPKVLGFAVAIVGSTLVISRGNLATLNLDSQTLSGDLLVVVSAVGWALYSTLGKELLRRRPPLLIVTLALNLSLPILAVIAALGAPGFVISVAAMSWRGWAAALFLGWACSALAYVLWYAALQHQEMSRVSVLQYLQPLAATGLGMLLLNESITWATAIGGGMILGGVALVNRQSTTKPDRS